MNSPLSDIARSLLRQKLCVVVTHLKAKIGNEQIRIDEARELLREVQRFLDMPSDDRKNAAVVICGDFNDVPHSGVYEVFAASAYQDEQLLRMSLSSVQEQVRELEPNPYTTFKYREKHGLVRRIIDYIWYSNERLLLKRYLLMPSPTAFPPNGLPSRNWPSDHLPLCAEFQWM
jgi:CCR4-NOT transcription complex subunit 6